MPRRAIDVDSFQHTNPIPCASRVGPLIASSVIVGRDPGVNTVPESAEAQYENCFHHIGEMLREAGATWDHIVRITFFVPDLTYRDACNPIWVRYFPDAATRPARHTQLSPGGGKAVMCEFIAYVD